MPDGGIPGGSGPFSVGEFYVPSSDPSAVKSASATFVGVGVLVATATKIITAAAVTLSGVGTLSATPTKIKPASAVFAGKGTLAATPSVIHSGSVSFAGKGALSATPTKIGGSQITGFQRGRRPEPRPYVLHVAVISPTLVESKAPGHPEYRGVAGRVVLTDVGFIAPNIPVPTFEPGTVETPLAPRSGVLAGASMTAPDEPQPIGSYAVEVPDSPGVDDAELLAALDAAGLL